MFTVHKSFRAQLPGANHPKIGDVKLLWIAKEGYLKLGIVWVDKGGEGVMREMRVQYA